jgi:hypothetical protein
VHLVDVEDHSTKPTQKKRRLYTEKRSYIYRSDWKVPVSVQSGPWQPLEIRGDSRLDLSTPAEMSDTHYLHEKVDVPLTSGIQHIRVPKSLPYKPFLHESHNSALDFSHVARLNLRSINIFVDDQFGRNVLCCTDKRR